jgi:hypothetical protein
MEVGVRMWKALGCGGGERSVQGSIPKGEFHKSKGLEYLASRPVWKRYNTVSVRSSFFQDKEEMTHLCFRKKE